MVINNSKCCELHRNTFLQSSILEDQRFYENCSIKELRFSRLKSLLFTALGRLLLAMAFLQALVIALNVASLEIREVKV